MVEQTLVIGSLIAIEAGGYRRAVFGRPPRRPIRIMPSAIISLVIHIGFHAAATAAATPVTAIAFVFAGWTTFLLWWRWAARAPKPTYGDDDLPEGPGGGDGGGGGGGPKDPPEPPAPGDRTEFDWDAFEREMADWNERSERESGRELVGAT